MLISLGVDLSARMRMQNQQSSCLFQEHSTIFPDIEDGSTSSAEVPAHCRYLGQKETKLQQNSLLRELRQHGVA